jgi:hypothetical protein
LVSISDISYNRADILCQNIPQVILLKLGHGAQDVADGGRHPHLIVVRPAIHLCAPGWRLRQPSPTS